MGWVIGRHCFYARSGDFSSLLSLTHLVALVLTGYGILSKSPVTNGPFNKLWVICVSSAFFTFSLICTRKLSEPVGKPTITTYILAPFISLSIGALVAQSYFHNALRGLVLHLILISFSLTGFPALIIFITVTVGISLGIVGLIHISDSCCFKIIWLDLVLFLWQSVGGLLMYKRFECLAMMIVSIKKRPLLCVNNYKPVEYVESELMRLIDRDEVIDLFAKSLDSQRTLSRALQNSNTMLSSNSIRSSHTLRSISSRVDSRLVETIITNRSNKILESIPSDFMPPILQRSNIVSSFISEPVIINDNDPYLNEFKNFEFEVINPTRRRSLNKLPICVKRTIGFMLYCLKRCYEMRSVFLRATWANEDLLPPRNVLGMFSCTIFEDWYVEWMHEFNVKFYADSVWILLLFCYHGTISSAIALAKHYNSISSKAVTSRYIFLTIRFITQPLAVTLVLLPLLLNKCRGSTMKARCYYLLSLLLCLIQLFFAIFDISWILTWENPGEISYNSYSVEMLLMHTSVILLCRYPAYFFLFLVYSFSFITLHFILSSDPRIRIISAEFAPQVVTAIGSFFFYIRPVDISRRMIFCRYVLPYLMHLRIICQEKQDGQEDVRLDKLGTSISCS
ncbi:conserved Plasmodium protein, unknown function [Babesia microti strain RI]|uniref:Uncharacterized protein n=1 Tax=Babesia microti (strain RI) TaxID=1133968 RepID=A0A1N6LWC9_BABMR|nr:conserved Plasmodium protein, unknown function [Babesia microti strain RI]SIO73178.1 conserved Plasmodium protein, unknown function [Babesia microti strain RI]|eukprot:XP_021337287.1 conserved Plasmodium protein, unknown function [Babesia microti strain RI]